MVIVYQKSTMAAEEIRLFAVYIIYMKIDGATEKYVGLTGPQFKKHLGNHKKSFNHLKYAHETTLSSYIWKVKEKMLMLQLSVNFVKDM